MLIKNIKYFFIILCQLSCIKCNKFSPNYTQYSNENLVKNQQPLYILADRETLLMRGHSTSFTDGYMDGCQSGQHHAGDISSNHIKNEQHAKINKDYIIGWQQGNAFCYEHMRNLIKNSGSNDPNIYRSKEAIQREKERMWLELKK